jgi:hypothetical protein
MAAAISSGPSVVVHAPAGAMAPEAVVDVVGLLDVVLEREVEEGRGWRSARSPW